MCPLCSSHTDPSSTNIVQSNYFISNGFQLKSEIVFVVVVVLIVMGRREEMVEEQLSDVNKC